MPKKIICVYDARWPDLFAMEARVLQRALGDAILALHHIGSTAVPGLIAKPVIDIAGEARSLEEIDGLASAMTSCGYEARGAYGIDGRRYFSKAATDPGGVGFHVHVFAEGSAHIDRHILFRNYLAASPETAGAYAKLKQSLSDEEGAVVPDYTERKAPFIERVLRLASADAENRSG